MGWKGTMRSLAAAARAAERDAQRRHKIAMKEQMIDDAAAAVAEWEDYTENLVSIHTDLADAINWMDLASKPKPPPPVPGNTHETAARRALDDFEPRFFDFLRGGSKKRRAVLEAELKRSQSKDQTEFQAAQRDYPNVLADWQSDAGLAQRLLAGEAAAIKEVIEEMQSLTSEDLIGSAVSFSIEDGSVHAVPEVHTDEIIPSFRRKQLASGRLSETKMPAGQFNELYQDYVASVALKVAGDLFHILPLDEITVTCVTEMLNSETGHQEKMPVLSVLFVRDTMRRLNLENLDPSDSMKNFKHIMDFKKTKGLGAVQPLKPLS